MDSEGTFRNAGDTWTSDALEAGDVAAVMERVRSDPSYLTARDVTARTPLMTAVAFDDARLVELMLEHGADPNAEANDGYTCLLTAVESEHRASIAIVSALIRAGADIHRTGIHGWTPLHMAAARGFVPKAQLLIDAGADVNRRKEIDGEETPLLEAAYQGQAGTVRLLLEHGADPTLRDCISQRTPLETAQYARKGPDPNVLELLQNPDWQSMHMEIQDQIVDHTLELSDLPPEQREMIRNLLQRVDPMEQYQKAATQIARNGDFEEVIRLLSTAGKNV